MEFLLATSGVLAFTALFIRVKKKRGMVFRNDKVVYDDYWRRPVER